MLCIMFALSLLDRMIIFSAYIAGYGVDISLATGARYSVVLLGFLIGMCNGRTK